MSTLALGFSGHWMRGLALRAAGLALVLAGGLPLAHAETRAVLEARSGANFGRLVFAFKDPVTVQTQSSSGVLIVSFDQTVNLDVERIALTLPAYISAARRDPDGRSVRFALSQPVTINTMAAGRMVFVDMMPSNWRGQPPALPAEVLAELSQAAIEGEKAIEALRRQQQTVYSAAALRVGTHPTFTRLSFTLPEGVAVDVDRDGRTTTLTIDAPVPFDVARARALLPSEIGTIDAVTGDDALTVTLELEEERAVRTFAEGDTFIIDIPRDVAGAVTPPDSDITPSALQTPPAASQPASPIDPVRSGPEAAPPARQGAQDGSGVEASQAERVAAAAATDTAPQAPAEAAPAASARRNLPPPVDTVEPVVRQARGGVEISFPKTAGVPAAALRRADQIWVVFDRVSDVALDALQTHIGSLFREVDGRAAGGSFIVRLALREPLMSGFFVENDDWTLALGAEKRERIARVDVEASFAADGRSILMAPVEGAGAVHWLRDPETAQRFAVVPLQAPVRAALQRRDMVDLVVLQTMHGLAFEQRADDLNVTATLYKVEVSSGQGLTLSATQVPGREPGSALAAAPSSGVPIGGTLVMDPQNPFDVAVWETAGPLQYTVAESELARAAASARDEEQKALRTRLAQFYLAHDRASEAFGVVNAMLTDDPLLAREPALALMRASALVLMGRADDALPVLRTRVLSGNPVADLWLAEAEAQAGALGRARDAFRRGEGAIERLPDPLQARFRETGARLAVRARDYATAVVQLAHLENLKTQADPMEVAVIQARASAGLGQDTAALELYRTAINGANPRAAAEAQLRATQLRLARKEIDTQEAIDAFARLSYAWRHDRIEAETLSELGALYAEKRQWHDAFATLRTAMTYHTESMATRTFRDDMSEVFASLFTTGEGASLATLEGLSLFYDYKELTPPGTRGDEMIRRLAERLVEVDLLAQAADLLEYQVDNRLTGIARVQLATRAAIIHLMNRDPQDAYRVLARTRQAGLPNPVLRARQLIEARALGELGRTDQALEMVEYYEGEDVDRLRADVLWAAERWQEAGEAREAALADRRTSSDAPLSAAEREEIVRIAVAYALSSDPLGLDRLRTRYGAAMTGTAEEATFNVITQGAAGGGPAFDAIARSVISSDTLSRFLVAYREQYPETDITSPLSAGGNGQTALLNGETL